LHVKEFTCISSHHSTTTINAFLGLLISHFDPTRLSALSLIEGPDASLRASINAVLDFKVLKPLRSWGNLERLVVWTCIPFSLDDNDIATLSSSWPKLCMLNLGTRDGWGKKMPTLKGLATLLDNCPEMQELHIVINACIYHDLPPLTMGRNKRTTALFLSDSPLMDPIYVASFLHLLLPKLLRVNTWETNSYKEWWATVNTVILGFYTMPRYRNQWSGNVSSTYGRIKPPKLDEKWDVKEEIARSTSLFS